MDIASMDALRLLVILLLAVPAVAAVVAAALGPGRAALIRQICLGATIADAVIALALAVGLVGARSDVEVRSVNGRDQVVARRGDQVEPFTTFRPEIVPGATAAAPHKTTWTLVDLGPSGAIQLYFGLDGLNIWL